MSDNVIFDQNDRIMIPRTSNRCLIFPFDKKQLSYLRDPYLTGGYVKRQVEPQLTNRVIADIELACGKFGRHRRFRRIIRLVLVLSLLAVLAGIVLCIVGNSKDAASFLSIDTNNEECDPNCDPETDSNCNLEPTCDPGTDPNCKSDPTCDPEADPQCNIYPNCDPETNPDCKKVIDCKVIFRGPRGLFRAGVITITFALLLVYLMIIMVGNATRDLNSKYLALCNKVIATYNEQEDFKGDQMRWRIGKDRQWIELWLDFNKDIDESQYITSNNVSMNASRTVSRKHSIGHGPGTGGPSYKTSIKSIDHRYSYKQPNGELVLMEFQDLKSSSGKSRKGSNM